MPTKEEALRDQFENIRNNSGLQGLEGASLLEEEGWFFPSKADQDPENNRYTLGSRPTADRLRILNAAINEANQKIERGEELTPREQAEYGLASAALIQYTDPTAPSNLQKQPVDDEASERLLEAQQESRAVLALEEIDPELFAEKLEEIELSNSVWDLAACYAAQQIIKPENTRDWLKKMLRVHRRRLSGGIGKHLLSNWPTSY